MQPNENGIKAWQWIVTVIVIIALIVIGFFVFGGKKTEAPVGDDTNPPTTETPGATSSNRIVMTDQYPGNVVYLSSVQLDNGGWVAIHKDDAGKPGAVIGSAYFEKGINTGKVNLTSATVEGGTYYAVLHTDDGDKKFDATKDVPLKDSKGDVIMRIFHASASATTEIKG